MKKAKKLLAALFGVVMLVSCMTTSVFAAETWTQDGLNAVIQTDKESYAANEDIQITVTVTNTNTFEVKNVSIESLLPDALTLKDGDLKSKTVDLKPGETLSISCVAVLEKDEPTTILPTTTEPETELPATTEPGTTTQPEETTTEETTTEMTTSEPSTVPDTTIPETPSTTEQTETTTDSGAILPVEPSTAEPTAGIIEGELTTVENTPDNPDTGSGATIVKVLLIALAAAAVVAAIFLITRKNSKKATKVISLVLCGAIAVSSFATVGFIKVGAEEGTQFSFSVDKTITVDNTDYTIQAEVSYDQTEEGTIKLYSDPKELDTSDEPQEILFYIDTENIADNLNVKLVDSFTDDEVIALKDDGSNGDATAHDGVYSATLTVDCSSERTLLYYATWNSDGSVINSKARKIEIIAPFTDQEVEEMGTVDNSLKVLTESDNYKNSTNEEKKKQMESELRKLKAEHLISEYYFSSDDSSVVYTYKNGIKAFWSVVPQKQYFGEERPDLPEIGIERKLTRSTISKSYNKSNNMLFISGWSNPNDPDKEVSEDYDRWYSELAEFYSNNGFPTTYSLRPSVEEYKTLLTQKDYAYIVIAEHGYCESFLSFEQLSFSTQEIETEEKDKLYYKDLNSGVLWSNRVIKGNGYYHLTPQFFSFYYEDKLDDSIIDMESCMGMGKGNHNNYDFSSAFLDDCKAETFIGYHNSVYIAYSKTITKSILDQMTQSETTSIGVAFLTACNENAHNDVEYMYKKYPEGDPIWSLKDESGKTFADEVAERDAAYPILSGNQEITFAPAISKLCSVSGSVLDAETGLPLEATVEVSRLGETIERKTNPQDGSFSFELEPGEYTIRITSPGYQFIYTTFNVPSGTDYQFLGEFNLTRLPEEKTTITGYVKDEGTEKYIPDVTVTVYDESGTEVVTNATTDNNGYYEIVLEKEGVYNLKFDKDGYNTYTLNSVQAIKGMNGLDPVYLSTVEDGQKTYYIYTAEDFNNIRNDLKGNYILMNDIDLSSYARNWVPIGYYNYDEGMSNAFTGHLDGNGHTIYGFNVFAFVSEGSDFWGLFGMIWNNAIIENLNLIGNIYMPSAYAKGYLSFGGLVGKGWGTIKNCSFGGSIYADIHFPAHESGFVSIGGIVGEDWDGGSINIVDCQNYASIQVVPNTNRTVHIGGVIARGTARHCYNSGNISCYTIGDTHTYVAGITCEQAIDCCNAATSLEADSYYHSYSISRISFFDNNINCVANKDMLLNGKTVKDGILSGTGMSSDLLTDWYNSHY